MLAIRARSAHLNYTAGTGSARRGREMIVLPANAVPFQNQLPTINQHTLGAWMQIEEDRYDSDTFDKAVDVYIAICIGKLGLSPELRAKRRTKGSVSANGQQ